MTIHSLAPAFTTIDYHSSVGAHVMTLCMTEPVDVLGDPSTFSLEDWLGGNTNWQTGVMDLVALLKLRVPTSTHFDRASFWTQEDADAAPLFRGAIAIDIDGTVAAPGAYIAVQETLSFRDTAGFAVRLQVMDAASQGDFAKYLNPAPVGADDLLAEFGDPAGFWSSRANNRPAFFISRTATFNEALRRAYRLT